MSDQSSDDEREARKIRNFVSQIGRSGYKEVTGSSAVSVVGGMSYDPYNYVPADFSQGETLGRRSRALGRYLNPPTFDRSLLRSNTIVDEEEFFMEFTMKINKELIKDLPGTINFMILGQNEALMQCRMDTLMPFHRLMRLYAASLGLARHMLVYNYKTYLVECIDSPLSIGLLEGGTIIVTQRRITSFTIAPDILD